jgi:diguanylate cyclase (GGDEF)-like protein
VVLLPETDRAAATAAAERIRARIAGLNVISTDKRGGPAVIANRTTSIGVSSRPENAESLPDLIQIADAAVYAAKEAGRDRVWLARGPDADPDAGRLAG